MPLKKPAAKTKEKTTHSTERIATLKRKPSAGIPSRSGETSPSRGCQTASKEVSKEDRVMDARTSADRRQNDRRDGTMPVEVERRTGERRAKVNRRRQIDPTTCERDYSSDEVEFMSALDEYKRRSGRMFPTCSEILEVIRGLGYEKRAEVPTATFSVEPVSDVALATEQAV